jgi:5,10-methylenetetrahydromethanopterin reductase
MISKVGLTPEDFEPIKRAYVEKDFEKARALMTDEMAELAIYGTPEDCVERINKLIRTGLKHIRFGPPLGPNPEETINLIGEDIIPHFRD